MRREWSCRPRARLLEPEPLKRSAENVAQTRQLLKVHVLAGDDLGLKRLDLNRHRRSLPDENLARLAQLVLAAKVIGEGYCNVAIAPRDYASAVDAAKHQRIVCHGGSLGSRTSGDPGAIFRHADPLKHVQFYFLLPLRLPWRSTVQVSARAIDFKCLILRG